MSLPLSITHQARAKRNSEIGKDDQPVECRHVRRCASGQRWTRTVRVESPRDSSGQPQGCQRAADGAPRAQWPPSDVRPLPASFSSRMCPTYAAPASRLGDCRGVPAGLLRSRAVLRQARRHRARRSSSSPAARCRGGWPASRWWRRPSAATPRTWSPTSSGATAWRATGCGGRLSLTGVATVFFYARLWRRSGVMTDLEFYEIRYSGTGGERRPRLPRDLSRACSSTA